MRTSFLAMVGGMLADYFYSLVSGITLALTVGNLMRYSMQYYVLALVVQICVFLVGGYAAALAARQFKVLTAAGTGVLMVVTYLGFLRACAVMPSLRHVPLPPQWYQLGELFAVIPVSICGGVIRVDMDTHNIKTRRRRA